jgi:hypothetical protein
MGSGRVLADTLARADRLGARTALLDAGFDVDRFEDLNALRALRAGPEARLCARTLAYLDRERLWPAPRPGSGVG